MRVRVMAWKSGLLEVMGCFVGLYTHGNLLTVTKDLGVCVYAHARSPMWRSEGIWENWFSLFIVWVLGLNRGHRFGSRYPI